MAATRVVGLNGSPKGPDISDRPLATPETYLRTINQLWKVPGNTPPTLDEASITQGVILA